LRPVHSEGITMYVRCSVEDVVLSVVSQFVTVQWGPYKGFLHCTG